MFKNIKNLFPVFEKNPNLVFLDTAASALKPKEMIDATNNCYSYEYANVHRGLYSLSSNLTKNFENVRIQVSDFISSNSEENIIFTKSATEGINLVVDKFSEKYLSKGDKVYVEGKLRTRKWQGDDGADRYTTEVNVDEFTFLSTKKESSLNVESNQSTTTNNQTSDQAEDDLPF